MEYYRTDPTYRACTQLSQDWIGNGISRQISAISVSAVTVFYLVRYGAVRCIHLVTPQSMNRRLFIDRIIMFYNMENII